MAHSRQIYDTFIDFFDHSDWIDFFDINWPELVLYGTFPDELRSKVLMGFLKSSELIEGSVLTKFLEKLGISYKLFGDLDTGFLSISQDDFNLLKLSISSEYQLEYYSMTDFYEYLNERHLIQS